MAKIIYKEGCEGQNRLESIEGIEIELLNTKRVLVYPKYSKKALLDVPGAWSASPIKTEIKALKFEDAKGATNDLLRAGSDAAKFVRLFRSEKFGEFNIPTLLAAGEILDQKGDIDSLAKAIEGADLLTDYGSFLWSCCRGSSYGAWYALGGFGFFYYVDLYFEFSAVPVSLYY